MSRKSSSKDNLSAPFIIEDAVAEFLYVIRPDGLRENNFAFSYNFLDHIL